jgi:hypothetical protein
MESPADSAYGCTVASTEANEKLEPGEACCQPIANPAIRKKSESQDEPGPVRKQDRR